jgi:hypothetical protein
MFAAIGRAHARPVAIFAALLAGLWPFGGPGDLVVGGVLALANGGPVDLEAALGVSGLEALVLVVPRAAVALAGTVALAAITLDSAGAGAWQSMLRAHATHVVRTRGIALVATTFVLGIPFYGLAMMIDRDVAPPVAEIGIALVVAAGSAWYALGDRIAMTSFSVAQDRRASDARDAAANQPYYLDTGAGKGGRVASGADDAVTRAGSELLAPVAWGLALAFVVADTARAAVVLALGPALAGDSVGIVLAAEVALVSACAWTFLLRRR